LNALFNLTLLLKGNQVKFMMSDVR